MIPKIPEPKDVVHLLCKFLREEHRFCRTKAGKKVKKPHSVYRCPRNNCKESNHEIVFQKGSGYMNPFNHLNTCVAGGDVKVLHTIYQNTFAEKKGEDL